MAKKSQIEKHKKGQKFDVRDYHRCNICKRPRGFMRRFGLCRICFRELAHKGQLPGVKKSSW